MENTLAVSRRRCKESDLFPYIYAAKSAYAHEHIPRHHLAVKTELHRKCFVSY